MKRVQHLPKRTCLMLWIILISVQYGAVGRQVELAGTTVFLHALNETNPNISSIRWRKSDILVGNWQLGNPNESSCRCCLFQASPDCRCTIFANGSLRLENAAKNDSGNYTVDLHGDEGQKIRSVDIELLVQEVASPPKVLVECGLDGKSIVTCSVPDSEGVELLWKDSSNRTWSAKHALSLGNHTLDVIVCVAKKEHSIRSSPPVSPQCRGRISLLVALGMFLCVIAFSMTLLICCSRMPKDEKEDVEENTYITMHGVLRKMEKDGVKESAEADNSVYVTCRTRCAREAGGGNEGNVQPA